MIISGWSKQTNLMKQPWIFGEPYTTINRKYMKLKMRLTPYLYTYSREAYDTGVPTVRAMVLEFPDDPVTWSKRTQYQFMSGEWLLVAPVYEDTPVRNDIYLPAGKWIDYWDGTRVQRADDRSTATPRRSTSCRCSSRPAPSSRCTRRCSTTARSRRTR